MAWKKGQSGNPKGRPPSTLALAEYIRANVEPKRIADCAIQIMEEGEAERDRLAAAKFLAEHGWSKPVVQVEVSDGDNKPLDLSGLSPEQVDALAKIDGDGVDPH